MLDKETSTLVLQGQSKPGWAVGPAGQYYSGLSNKKLKLKTHSAGHNCILPRYQLPDVMSGPVVITLAPQFIDPAIMVRGEGKEVLCLLPPRLCLLSLHLSEERINEQ